MHFKVLLSLIVSLALFTTACNTNNQLGATNSIANEEQFVVPDVVYDIEYTTDDGFVIKGKLHKAKKAYDKISPMMPEPPIILLHMLGHDQETYTPLLPCLIEKGFSVLTIDFRGHGKSTKMSDGTTKSYKNFTEKDWANMPEDVNGAIKCLETREDIDSSTIALVGASVGANTAIISAAENPGKVNVVVALSPGLDYKGLKPGEVINKSKAKIFLVAADDDKYSADSVRELGNISKANTDITIYPKGGHGTNLFSTTPEILQVITNWVSSLEL